MKLKALLTENDFTPAGVAWDVDNQLGKKETSVDEILKIVKRLGWTENFDKTYGSWNNLFDILEKKYKHTITGNKNGFLNDKLSNHWSSDKGSHFTKEKSLQKFDKFRKKSTNPELDKKVKTFVEGLAKFYSYSTQDALYAIEEAFNRLGYKK